MNSGGISGLSVGAIRDRERTIRTGGAGWIAGALVVAMMVFVQQASAVPPNFQAAGTTQSSTGALSSGNGNAVAWPTHQTGDIGLLIVETANEAVTLGTNGGNWTEVTGSPQGTGTAGGTAATRLTVFWSRATSNSMGSVGVNDSGDHQIARILTFRGVISSGDPWDVTAGDVRATASTAVSIPGNTTTVPDTLIVAIVANGTDTTNSQTSGYTNANLTSLNEQVDNNTSSNNGGGFGVATGVMAVAGDYGATTATLSNSSVQGRMSIALKPPPAPSVSSAANQSFTVGDPGTTASTLTVTDATGTPTITAANDIRIRIPATFNMTWDTAVTTVTLGGGAAGKASATLSAYEDSNRTAVLNVTSNFAAGDQITIAGLAFANFTATSAADNLELVVAGTGGATADEDDKTITIANSNVRSAGSRILNDDASRTPVAAEDVAVTNWGKGNKFLVTIGIQTRSGTGARCENNQGTNKLQWRNVTDAPATWNNLGTAAGPEMILFNSANLVDNNALTLAEAQIVGTGTYVNGKEAENNNDKSWSRFEDGQYSAIQLAIDPSGGIDGKTYQFRFIVNPGMCDSGSNVLSVNITLSTSSTPNPGSFNAFETSTGASAVTGSTYTKLVGTAFGLDVVAISGGAKLSTFTADVTVDLLANTTSAGLDANNCPTSFTTIQGPTTATITAGRSTVNFSAVATAYRDVRVRVRYPTSSPTVTSCSTDNFSIRPTAFSSVTSNMTNAASSGAPFARAGDAFTITAVAGAGYNGTPSMDNTKLTAHAGAAQNGSVAGAFAAADSSTGTATGAAFTYSEVGNFTIGGNGVYDGSFTGVDQSGGDCTSDFSNTLVGGKYGCSFGNTAASAAIGRFMPDHFALSAGSLTNRSASGCSPASTFTYMNEGVRLQFTLTAQNAANATTQNYAGAYAKLDLSAPANINLGARDLGGAGTNLTTRIDTSGGSSGTWSNGVATNVQATVAISRAGSPDGPYGQTKIGVAPQDTDGTAIRSSSFDIDVDGAGGNDHAQVGSDTLIRFGRLFIPNTFGTQNINLNVPIEAQYWTGAQWQRNLLDNCTSIVNANLALGNYSAQGTPLTSANLPQANATVSTAIASGLGQINVIRPSGAATGSVALAIKVIGTIAAAPVVCGGWISANANPTGAGLEHLEVQGTCSANYDKDPVGTINFGVTRNRFIYNRENF